MAYRVKAVTAVIKIGGTEKYLNRGSFVPSAATNIEHLLAVGLLEEVELLEIVGELVDETPQGDGDDQKQGDDGKQSEPVTVPPKAGAGASAEAWRNYAKSIEVEVADDASRDAVIAAVEAAGKPTE